ncbi:MAG TPA: SDR family oxidoreductase [Ilumatobacteraceae bacterium]|nr:SDR family oxidoreductase [Ilumatobacteraceae bacterium]
MTLDGRTVMIVGGTSGLGLATARRLKDAGAVLAIVGRDAAKVADARRLLGPDVTVESVDAADASALHAFVAGLDKIDHVISFAGLQPAAPIGQADHAMFASAFDARVWAARNCCAAAIDRMPPHGSFTFCSGLSAVRPRAGRSAGAVATAVESFARAMAVELAPIRVNAICPGAFDTEVLRRAFGADHEAALARIARSVPLGRVGQPDEIAHAIEFLICNTYTTGITLRVDGGALLV